MFTSCIPFIPDYAPDFARQPSPSVGAAILKTWRTSQAGLFEAAKSAMPPYYVLIYSHSCCLHVVLVSDPYLTNDSTESTDSHIEPVYVLCHLTSINRSAVPGRRHSQISDQTNLTWYQERERERNYPSYFYQHFYATRKNSTSSKMVIETTMNNYR